MPSSISSPLWHFFCPALLQSTARKACSRNPAKTCRSYFVTIRLVPSSSLKCRSSPSLPSTKTADSEASAVPDTSLINTPRPVLRPVKSSYEAVLQSQLRQHGQQGRRADVLTDLRLLVRKFDHTPAEGDYVSLLNANTDCQQGSAAEIEELLREMASTNLQLGPGAYEAAFKALAVHPNASLRLQLQRQMYQRKVSVSTRTRHYWVAALLREQRLEQAWREFRNLKRNLRVEPWLYDLCIFAFASVRAWDEVLTLLAQEPQLTSGLWSYLLHEAVDQHQHAIVRVVWAHGVILGPYVPSSGILTGVLDICARQGDDGLAVDVARVCSERGYPFQAHHYEALLDTFAAAQKFKTFLDVTSQMMHSQSAITKGTMRSLVVSLLERKGTDSKAKLRALTDTIRVNLARGESVHIAVVNAVMEAYVSHGALDEALDLFNAVATRCQPSGPNLDTYNILLRACCGYQSGQRIRDARAAKPEAFLALMNALGQQMVQRNVQPDADTYDALLRGNIHANAWDSVWYYVGRMLAQSTWPSRATTHTLIAMGAWKTEPRVWAVLHFARESRLSYFHELDQVLDKLWQQPKPPEDQIRRWASGAWLDVEADTPSNGQKEEEEPSTQHAQSTAQPQPQERAVGQAREQDQEDSATSNLDSSSPPEDPVTEFELQSKSEHDSSGVHEAELAILDLLHPKQPEVDAETVPVDTQEVYGPKALNESMTQEGEGPS